MVKFNLEEIVEKKYFQLEVRDAFLSTEFNCRDLID